VSETEQYLKWPAAHRPPLFCFSALFGRSFLGLSAARELRPWTETSTAVGLKKDLSS
jgi:hypothetical protein